MIANPPGRLAGDFMGRLAGMKYDKMQRGTLRFFEACLFLLFL